MPFPFYSTAAPNPGNKNSITKTATDYGYRDFLLLKNLAPVYPQALNLSPATTRIGEPILDTSINNDTNVIPFGLPLEVEGLFRYDIAVLPNQFKNDDPNAPSLINIEDISTTQGVFGNVDFPQGTQSYPTSATQQIKDLGLYGKTNYANFRKNNTKFNLYLDAAEQTDVSDWISLQPIGVAQQINGYLNEYGALNLGDNQAPQIANIIGSVLNGQGLGIAKNGVVTNFDIRSSLAGRILGAAGVINDTRLGSIGAQQLALALANNAAFNVQEEILGSLNVRDNILSLVKDGTTVGFRPNYQITVPSGGLGRAADYTARILGFTLPKSYLSDAGSIFLSESNSANIERANSMILNTGRGQVTALISNVNANIIGTGQYDNPSSSPFRSGYVPGYKDNKGQKAINPELYAFYNSDKSTIYNFVVSDPNKVIPEISYNREKMVSDYGFKSPEETFTGPRGNSGYNNRKLSDVGFTWTTSQGGLTNSNAENEFDELLGDKKSLLVKTQKLFNSKGMKSIVTSKGDMGNGSTQIQTANGGGFSKGSAVLTAGNYNANGQYAGIKNGTADQVYCRSWTTIDRYDTVSKLIRNRGLDATYPYRYQSNGSVLDDNGFVKIAPYVTDSATDPKKYMFSIENLAWCDDTAKLPPCEIGPGDLVTGKKGRIMWFPPYNISINESSNVNWESTAFIGRGEPVYTYNNTERSGTISFSIIVDHPSYANSFRGSSGPDDNYIASFFAGCVEPSQAFVDKLTVSEINDIKTETVITPQQKTLTPETPPQPFTVYYPNDSTALPSVYENGLSGTSANDKIDYNVNPDGSGFGIGTYVGGTTSQTAWNDINNFGINGWKSPLQIEQGGQTYEGILDPLYIADLSTYLEEKCPNCVLTITSYASAQGNAKSNDILSNGRTNSLYGYLYQNLYFGKSDDYKKRRIKKSAKNATITGSGCNPKSGSQTDTKECKMDRKSVVTFEFDSTLQAENTAQPEPIVQTTNRRINTRITNRFYTECNYFEKLKETDQFVFDSFREKIRYFHPAFHSMTPEGLNSRLTFLQQCTRQGPTNEAQGAVNLAFGRAPVCILRIGDFFNTKVIFDNLSIDYEPLQWDLNPEGVGVQPMVANVTLSFKMLGGSSLLGPINKLQNALSFNYYANTQVYDSRADYISRMTPLITGWGIVDGATGYSVNTVTTDLGAVEFGPINQPAANNIATNAQVANQTPTVTTSGYTAVEIQRCLSIVSVQYAIDTVLNEYEVTVKLSFTPRGKSEDGDAIDNFILKDNEYVRGKLYILSDTGKNQKVFGDLNMYQNDSDTVIVQNNTIPTGGNSSDEQFVNSLQGGQNNNANPRDSIVLKYNIQDEDANNFITDALSKPSPSFRIEWGSGNGAKANTSFPYGN